MVLPNQKQFQVIGQEISSEVLGKTTAGVNDRPSSTQVNAYINDAYQEVCESFDWSWMYRYGTFSTVVGQATPYDLRGVPAAGDFPQKVLAMTIPAQNKRLVPMEHEDWLRRYPARYDNEGNGTPDFFVQAPFESGNDLKYYLGPGPADAVYAVRWFAKVFPANMTTTTEYPIVPSQWQDLIKYKALEKIYSMLGSGSTDRKKNAQEDYQRLWNRAWVHDQALPEGTLAMRDFRSQLASGSASRHYEGFIW